MSANVNYFLCLDVQGEMEWICLSISVRCGVAEFEVLEILVNIFKSAAPLSGDL